MKFVARMLVSVSGKIFYNTYTITIILNTIMALNQYFALLIYDFCEMSLCDDFL